MSIQKSFLSRLFSRKQKQAAWPWNQPSADGLYRLESKPVDKPKHRPCHYIPTDESPWVVIIWRNKKWQFFCTSGTREGARNIAKSHRDFGEPAKVVRAMIPTR